MSKLKEQLHAQMNAAWRNNAPFAHRVPVGAICYDTIFEYWGGGVRLCPAARAALDEGAAEKLLSEILKRASVSSGHADGGVSA
jgi:hypothetical protein